MDPDAVPPFLINGTRVIERVHKYEIYEAVLKRDHKLLRILLSRADTYVINNKKEKPSDELVLDLAVSQGDEISVELLLARGAKPDYERALHFWPKSTLSRAISCGNHKIIRLLIDKGCDLDAIIDMHFQENLDLSRNFFDYWFYSMEMNDLILFQLFLECKDRKISNDKWSQGILLKACRSKSTIIIEYLLDQGVSIESVDENGWTCIFHAVITRHIDVAPVLINRGANLKHKDNMGRSILHVAAMYLKDTCNYRATGEFVQLLIDKGADINATDNKGLTPINAALNVDKTYFSRCIFEQFLRQRDIDLSIPDMNGSTFLHHLIRSDYFPSNVYDQNEIFFRLDVDVNARDKNDRTPLHFINTKNMDKLKVLLEFGACTNALHDFEEILLKDKNLLTILKLYQLKRTVANLGVDPNIDAILLKYSSFQIDNFFEYMYDKEIKRMRQTILCDKMTYYDFLHAKKGTCMNIAKRPEMREIFIDNKHCFNNYANMLAKKYICGKRSFEAIENEIMATLRYLKLSDSSENHNKKKTVNTEM